ncbi:hypothetical protein L1787_06760 [Acuticoccus sp. M5D2P5]|nr:hypothetical protein [Acuticoccus kalidii]MCF3933115.1 hypothetical protein [Acuticoccus kalidii]
MREAFRLAEGKAKGPLMQAIERVCAASILTPDRGGTATAKDATDAI